MSSNPLIQSEDDKNIMKVKKGAWSAEEDDKLKAYIRRYGIWNWNHMPKAAGLARSGKSCRLRWMNYLRPNIKHGNFTKEEEGTIIKWQQLEGNRWSTIASKLPGRTDNEVKNYWNSRLKKRARLEKPAEPSSSSELVSSDSSTSALKAPEHEDASPESPQIDYWFENEFGELGSSGKTSTSLLGSVDGPRESDHLWWDMVVLPPLEDVYMGEDFVRTMFMFDNPLLDPEFSTDGYAFYDSLWEN